MRLCEHQNRNESGWLTLWAGSRAAPFRASAGNFLPVKKSSRNPLAPVRISVLETASTVERDAGNDATKRP